MFCTKCGSSLRDDMRFCTECGAERQNLPVQQDVQCDFPACDRDCVDKPGAPSCIFDSSNTVVAESLGSDVVEADGQGLVEADAAGDVVAIRECANRLWSSGKYFDAQEWYLKGAEAGDAFCMVMYARVTNIIALAGIGVTSLCARDEIDGLLEAEKWCAIALGKGESGANDALDSTYETMAWCHYLVALQEEDRTERYREVIRRYELISKKPVSRCTYAYARAMGDLGEHEKSFEADRDLSENHDVTLEDYMLAMVYISLSEAYFRGRGCEADYELARQYAGKAMDISPEWSSSQCLHEDFENGKMRREFDRLHSNGISAKKPASATSKAISMRTVAAIAALVIVLLVLAGSALSREQNAPASTPPKTESSSPAQQSEGFASKDELSSAQPSEGNADVSEPSLAEKEASNNYILPDSSYREYSRSELEELSDYELYIARNEIYARYGRGFKNEDLSRYFSEQSWYTQRYTPEEFDAMESPLNNIEKKNADTMLAIESDRSSPYLSS